MVDGWRTRFLAPVYAFVISFVFVLILGAALSDPAPDNPAPANTMTRIQFMIPGQSELPEVFRDFPVRVKPVGGESRPADKPGLSREFTLPTPDWKIEICATLPAGWSAQQAVIVNGESCLTPDVRGVITLVQGVD